MQEVQIVEHLVIKEIFNSTHYDDIVMIEISNLSVFKVVSKGRTFSGYGIFHKICVQHLLKNRWLNNSTADRFYEFQKDCKIKWWFLWRSKKHHSNQELR